VLLSSIKMIGVDDAIAATIQIMQAPAEQIQNPFLI
jgi:hypothetical protein